MFFKYLAFPVIKIKKEKKNNDDLRLESARTFNEIDKYADAWNLLALNAPQQHPVLTHSWISAYLKSSLKEGESWFCIFAFDNYELVGILPLLVRESRFLGNKYLLLSTPNYPHTRWVDFLFKEKYGGRVVQLFASYLNGLRPRIIRLTMSHVLCNSPTFDILAEGIHGIYSYSYPNGYASIIPVEGSFNDYKKRLSKKLTGNLRRSNNSLKKLENYSVIVIEDGKDALEDLLSFASIEQSGWKGKNGTAIKYKFWKFFEELVQNMGKNGWLEWYFLETENKRIAGYLTIPFGRSAFILKTGYNEEYRFLSPGSFLTEKLIEHIFSTGKYDVINFFTDFEWLLRWNVERKPYYRLVIAFNNPLSFFSTRLPYIFYSKFTLVRSIRISLYRAIRNISGK